MPVCAMTGARRVCDGAVTSSATVHLINAKKLKMAESEGTRRLDLSLSLAADIVAIS